MAEEPSKISSPAMLQWQLERLTGQLMLVGDHYADQTCPCTYGYSDPSGRYVSESCIPKHLLSIYEYSVETAVMTDNAELKALLTAIADEAKEIKDKELEKICGKEVEQADITEWAREKRKLIEPHLYTIACQVPEGEKAGTIECCSYRMKPSGEVLLSCRKDGAVLDALYPTMENAKREAGRFCEVASVAGLAEYIRDEKIIRLLEEDADMEQDKRYLPLKFYLVSIDEGIVLPFSFITATKAFDFAIEHNIVERGYTGIRGKSVIRLIEKGVIEAGKLSEEAELHIPAPFGWVGGKRQLAKRIVSLIPPHKTYVEPFCGAASVFWAKEPSGVEVLNDLDPDLMRFYRDIGKIDRCDVVAIAKDWDRLKAKEGKLEVCELLAEVNCSFGSVRGSKALPKAGQQRKQCYQNAPQFHRYLPQYQARLKDTKLHNEDWQKVVGRYDSPETFFYFDPPYHGTSRGYRYSEDQLAKLAETLPDLKGKWLLSYDDHTDVRRAFRGSHMLEVDSRYTIKAGSNTDRGRQLLIANYPLEAKMAEGLGQAVITGLGIGTEFKVVDELAKYIKGKEAEMATDIERIFTDQLGLFHAYAKGLLKACEEKDAKEYKRILDKASHLLEIGKLREAEMAVEIRNREVICFETEKRGIVEPPNGVIFKDTYWLLSKVSPNVPNCGIYDRVPMSKFIGRARLNNADAEYYKYLSKEQEYTIATEIGGHKEWEFTHVDPVSGEAIVFFKTGIIAIVARDGRLIARINPEEKGDGKLIAPPAPLEGINKTPISLHDPLTPPKGGSSMISKSEMGVIEARYKSYHSAMFKPRDADEWLAHGKQMETLWGGYDLPPATIPPALYVLSMQMQVAPSRLTAKRLKQALDEDLGVDVPLPVAQNLLGEYAYFEEQAPYARQIPKLIEVFKTTIHKHYRSPSAFHKGSIRTLKPKPDVLVTMGCLKKDKWDAKSVTCTPNPTVLSTVVPKTKEYLDEVEHLKLVHPKVKVNHREKEVGVEPRLSDEERRELEAVDKAVDNTEVVDDG